MVLSEQLGGLIYQASAALACATHMLDAVQRHMVNVFACRDSGQQVNIGQAAIDEAGRDQSYRHHHLLSVFFNHLIEKTGV